MGVATLSIFTEHNYLENDYNYHENKHNYLESNYNYRVFFTLGFPLKFQSTKKLILARLGVS